MNVKQFEDFFASSPFNVYHYTHWGIMMMFIYIELIHRGFPLHAEGSAAQHDASVHKSASVIECK